MQQRGSPYGAPPPQQQQPAELTPFHHAQMAPEAAPPISTRPPQPPAAPSYEELGVAGDDPLGGPAEEGGSGGMSGNRWPRQETLALLKIRSDMDAAFRDATLKGPLWEEVSRKLGELGHRRSAKKCKEKFENVHKYYKRTKEGRAGRQDGKSYRFFSQLEALHTTANSPASIPAASMATTPPSTTTTTTTIFPQNTPPSAAAAPTVQPPMQIPAETQITAAPPPPQLMVQDNPAVSNVAAAGISFSSNTSSSSGSEEEEDDDEATEEGPSRESGGGRKRKREGGGGGGGAGNRKVMAFFEGLMRQVMERQEAMQQRFLEAIEKREQDRMIREEAWRRQEMSRMAREHELAAQERAAAASRDAAIISCLQKVTGQTVQLPPATAAPSPIQTPTPPPSVRQPQIHQQPPHQQQTPPPPQQHQQNTEIIRQHQQIPPVQPPSATSTDLVPVASSEQQEGPVVGVSLDPASSRWPKTEVHALINLRSELDSRYQESGPKGPLWEAISAGMQRLGYNRSAKRCKEKWENINKYFKKVKESNKKRPDDAKTCPYFHQLDALYRSKLIGNSGGGNLPALTQRPPEHDTHHNPSPIPISMIPPPPPQQPPQQQHQGEENKNGNAGSAEAGGVGPSNRGIALSSFFGEGTSTGTGGGGGGGDNSGIMKKPEDIVKESMGQSSNDNNDYAKLDEAVDSDNMEEDEEAEEDDEDGENGKGQYRIQLQRPNNVGSNSGGGSAAAPSRGRKASSGSFPAMVR